jgi:hypothetical protein
MRSAAKPARIPELPEAVDDHDIHPLDRFFSTLLERIRAVVDSGTAAKTDTRRSRRGVSTSSQRRDLRGIRAKNPSQRVMRGILTIYAGPEISKRKTQVQ